MKKSLIPISAILLLMIGIGGLMYTQFTAGIFRHSGDPGEPIPLPQPSLHSDTSIEEALQTRRSVREYRAEPLSIQEISQLLWAGQGISDPRGRRTAPSAGALYPLEIYLLAGEVENLEPGIYKYQPQEHELIKIAAGDKRQELQRACLDQEAIGDGAAVIAITAVYERTTQKYGERGRQYVHMEVGAAAQNIYLQAVSIDLATVFMGAFYDEEVKAVLQLEPEEQPLGFMPVGRQP